MRARHRELQTLFRRATRHHEAGQLAEAEQAYREALALEPDHADSLHGLGVLAHQLGRADLAIGYIGKAMQAKPHQAHYHINIGRAMRDRGHVEEARAAFHIAVLLTPDDPVAQFNLATALADLGRVEEALACYRAALLLDPSFADACANMGLLLHTTGNLRDAETCFGRLAALRPDEAAAHGLWGVVLRQLDRLADAEMPLQDAVRLDPQNAEWPNVLGATLIELGRAADAEAPLRAALTLKPDHVDAHNNLGLALQSSGRLDDAAVELRAALALQPDNADIHANLGTVLRGLGRFDAAEDCWHQALARDPQHAGAHFNLGTALLAKGDFASGWPQFEWRDRVPGSHQRRFSQPRWTGEKLDDGVVLIHAEQGFGDTIQFARFVALAASRTRVVLEAPLPLVRLLSTLCGADQIVLRGADQIIARGEALPRFDAHCPLLSLPGLLGTTLETIPAGVPYLQPPQGGMWQERLNRTGGLRVGLCWAGRSDYREDRWRSLPAAALSVLAVPGVTFVCLQKNASQPAPPDLNLLDWTDELADFADTAALIAQLDLVISVDTAVAHLAGALGKPVWLLNRFDADWRWLRGRTDSPWYPTLRQFRQSVPNDWSAVLQEVATALRTR
jgi:tetratricopeptide (TPR) repeat protein